ncbi:uncharacterized protein B0H18DRAFT_985143, partial [Fomitopsis serialis]|uniref:uncharacterized protein n=1 Tax=Fomitopsis serialis TaxID=139415 RepID=UPI002007C387
MRRSVSIATVMKIEKAGSDLRALVRTPREALSRSERPPRASQTTDRDMDELPQPIQSHPIEANGEGSATRP